MRNFLVGSGYPSERAEMLLEDMKPYHRPEWWVIRRPINIDEWNQAATLKKKGIIKGVDRVDLVDRHCFVDRIDWGGIGMYERLSLSLILIPFGHFVIPGDDDEWDGWRHDPATDDILSEMEESSLSFQTELIPLKSFTALDSDHRERLFSWKDDENWLEETASEVFDGVYDHESGNPTYC